MIQDSMPERVVQVEFSEVQRIPTGLTRVVKVSEVCRLFLEKGCVVVRELVEEEGGRKVVKSVAVPLNSGLVRTIYFEDEVLKGPERITEDEAKKIVGTGFDAPAVHPGGLNGKPETLLPAGEDTERQELVERLKADGTPALQKVAEHIALASTPEAPAAQQSVSQEHVGGHTPASVEEAILNRRPRRR